MKTMYEINQHETNGLLTHFTVTPITVIRRGILEGCSKESITAISHDGHRFQGNPDNYFDTEEAAWRQIEEDLIGDISHMKRDIENRIKILAAFQYALNKIQYKSNENIQDS